MNRCTAEFRKITENDDVKLDELEQYDRRLSLELEGVPYKGGNMTQTVIDLAALFNVNVKEEISIAHRLPLRRRGPNTRGESNGTKKHHTIIIRFVNCSKKNLLYAD